MVRGPRGASASKPGSVRIRDVATAAGVSTATVSYVLNDTPGQTITEATRARVRRVADGQPCHRERSSTSPR